MKVTRLVQYMKKTGFSHVRGKNIAVSMKHKIYEAYSEKMKTMSKNRFCAYFLPFWIKQTTVKEIIKTGERHQSYEKLSWDRQPWEKQMSPLEYAFWEHYERNNYQKRYTSTSRTKKVDQLSDIQVHYLRELRENEPNKGFKLFDNSLFIPENRVLFSEVFWWEFSLSRRLFYDFIEKYQIVHRVTKRQKIGLLAEHKKNNTLETYLAEMHHIYAGYKALHRWQVDIKYLTDIPNYVKLWLFDIYLYEITFSTR